MKFNNWKIDKLENISSEEFFLLIDKNRNHIFKSFPLTVSNCLNLETTAKLIAESIEIENKKQGYYFYIRSLETNKLIGYSLIKKIDLTISKCEFAYFIDKDFEGKGITSTVVTRMLDFCFNDLTMNKIFICTSKINFGSQHIALKNGFQQEGILREEFKNGDGILEDIVYFGLLRKEYKQ